MSEPAKLVTRDSLAAATARVEEEDEQLGVVGRGRKIDRIFDALETPGRARKKQRLSISIPRDLSRWAREEAQRQDVPISAIVEQAIRLTMTD